MKSILPPLAAILALVTTPSSRFLVPPDLSLPRPGQEVSREPADRAESIAIDGHVYPLLRVGVQTWLAENLLATRDRDGNSLTWIGAEGADTQGKGSGKLYPWEAARRTAPAGWRLPTVKDWQALIALSGEESKAGRKLLRTGPGEFGALLIGGVDVLGRAFGEREQAIFWTAAETSVDQAFCLEISRGGETRLVPALKTSYLSVRLIRDDPPEFATGTRPAGRRD